MFKLIKILEEVESPDNGKIQVVQTLEGRRILVGGISQSGWLVKKVWDTALKRLKQDRPKVKKILILGLGGGSIAEVVAKLWSDAEMVGLDIDKEMVELGKKYLELGCIKNLKIVIGDAEKFVAHNRDKYDLVLIDLYKGQVMPEQFKKDSFIQGVKRILDKDGVAVFNHLFTYLEKNDAYSFEGIVRKFFSTIVRIYPEANVVYLCF